MQTTCLINGLYPENINNSNNSIMRKQPNKWTGFKRHFITEGVLMANNTGKGVQHHSLEKCRVKPQCYFSIILSIRGLWKRRDRDRKYVRV